VTAVREIYEDAEGSLWVAAEGEGIRRIRPRIFQVVDSHQGLPHDQVQAVCEGQNGDVWLAPQLGGLSRYSAAGFVETLPATTNLIVTSVLPDGKGWVWAGTVAASLLHYDGAKVERSLKHTPFRERQIRVLFPDPKGQLWVSLFPSGLTRFGGDQLIWPAVYRGLGIPDQSIWAMSEDRDGGLWVGMIDGGVFRLQDNKVVSYQRTEGLPGIAIGALCLDATGVLWVGTLGGGLGCLRDGKYPPPLALEQVLVKGNAVALGNTLELDWDHGNIEFDYTALSFIAPEKVRFRRQLVGFDPDWVEAGGSRSAIYPQLDPGRYEFRFTACNNDEVWNEQPCKLALVVTPAWWQTLWWRFGMVALFAAVVAGLARYYSTVAMRRRLARLEQAHAVEKERTRIARDIHDDVGARLTQMAYLSDLVATELPQGVHRGHLHEIARASRRTVQALDEIVWAVNPRKDSLAHLLEYISQYANSFFRGTNIRCRQDLPATVPDWPLPAEFRHHIFLAAKEAFNNIQKHSRATEVWIRVAFRPPRLELIIEDNGAGFAMPEAKLSRDGLQNMHDRLATLNGVCDIASEAGRGTRLTMSLSLPQIGPPNQKEP
jgi:signal transduction histidine kinase